MPRPRNPRAPTATEQLSALLGYPCRLGRPPKLDLSSWAVSDNWPDAVPVTEAEVALFERWFGDLFNEMLGPDQ